MTQTTNLEQARSNGVLSMASAPTGFNAACKPSTKIACALGIDLKTRFGYEIGANDPLHLGNEAIGEGTIDAVVSSHG